MPTPPGLPARLQASAMSRMDAARRGLLAAARDCGPQVHVSKVRSEQHGS